MCRPVVFLVAVLLGLWFGAIASGQEGGGPAAGSETVLIVENEGSEVLPVTQGATAQPVERMGALSLAARTTLGLGLVLVLLGGMVALGRKLLPRSAGMFRSPAVVVMGRSYLDPKRSVYLLKIGGRILVVGSSEGGLSCLSEVTDHEEVNNISALAGSREIPAERGVGFGAQWSGRVARMVGLVRSGENQVEEESLVGETVEGDPDTGIAGLGDDCTTDSVADCDELEQIKRRIEGLKHRLQTIS
jgi:flagellar biogenesis protein FliO